MSIREYSMSFPLSRWWEIAPEPEVCVPKSLPGEHAIPAAQHAARVNPVNAPAARSYKGNGFHPMHLAVMTGKYWPAGTKIPVAFLDTADAALKGRILSHANAWGLTANVGFAESSRENALIRVARNPGGGYWSMIGTDHEYAVRNGLQVGSALGETLNLDSFSLQTSDSEYRRVVRHEFGHALGFPHEHSRVEIVKLLDPARTIAYFQRTQGWSADEIRAQILTALDPATFQGDAAEQQSIMCYQFPGECTISGRPITGGADLSAEDRSFAAKVYPGLNPPPVQPPVQPPVPPVQPPVQPTPPPKPAGYKGPLVVGVLTDRKGTGAPGPWFRGLMKLTHDATVVGIKPSDPLWAKFAIDLPYSSTALLPCAIIRDVTGKTIAAVTRATEASIVQAIDMIRRG